MKTILYPQSGIIISVLTWLLFSCNPGAQINLTNNLEIELIEQRITIKRSEFACNENQYIDLKDLTGKSVPIQHDDLNSDGVWDEVAFEYSLDPLQSVSLYYDLTEADNQLSFESKTNAYLGYSPSRNKQFESVASAIRPVDHVAMSVPYLYQYEGPGWESDLVAFRSYFDSRNGKDIFGKITSKNCLTDIGTGENYHSLQDWGMDILKVGNSLGAGSLALLKNDSVYRLGKTESAEFRIVCEGPVRTIIELTYGGWQVENNNYSLMETITIWAGKRSYTSEVRLAGGTGLDTLVTGIVDLKKAPKSEIEESNYQIIYTHGNQSENNDILGMGILISNKNFVGYKQAPESGDGITNTYMAFMKPINGAYTFHFYAGWELESSDFSARENFDQALRNEAMSLNQIIEIKI
jgi:hypothetical protein